MRHDIKKIAQNWSYRGCITDQDLDSFVSSNIPTGVNSLQILIGGLFRLIDEKGSVNSGNLNHLITILERIEKRIDGILSEQQRNAVADGILLTLSVSVSVASGNLATLDDIKLKDVRSRNAIRKSGCKTPIELAAYGADRLMSLKNVGVSSVGIIRNFLHANYGLTLAE